MNTKNLYGLCVGVGAYTHLNQLSCPATDAADMAAVLRANAPTGHVSMLVDASATKRAILAGLDWLAHTAGQADTAVVYLSGHGGLLAADPAAPAYFCPVDATPPSWINTCISSGELTTALRAIHSGRLIVLLDTCYGGGIGDPRQRSSGVMAGFSARNIADLVEGNGRVILAASRPDEPAWELRGMRNGLFTNYLLRALGGEVARADGTVWVSELFGYVSREVRRHGCQHPYQKAIGEDFVVLVRPAIDRRARTSLDNDRVLRSAMRASYNRAELALLCSDLGLSLEDLPSQTLETQLMDLIDHCRRHGLYTYLIERVQADRPNLALNYGPQ